MVVSERGEPVTTRMQVYYHPLYTDGIHPDARFPRTRYVRLSRRLRSGLAGSMIEICEAPEANREVLLMAHEPGYVDRFLAGALSDKEVRRIGLRPWTPQLRPRTLRIVGGAIAASTRRWPPAGSRATWPEALTTPIVTSAPATACSTTSRCVPMRSNDWAIWARLILDLDVHQGDGTATILAGNPEAMTISIHCGANFPFRKAQSDLDLAVPPDAGDEACLPVVAEAIQRGMAFKPDLVLYQAGVDGLATDALGRLSWTRAGFSSAIAW